MFVNNNAKSVHMDPFDKSITRRHTRLLFTAAGEGSDKFGHGIVESRGYGRISTSVSITEKQDAFPSMSIVHNAMMRRHGSL